MFASIIMSLILAASPSVEACKKKYPNSNLSCEHPISLPRPPEPECVPYCDASGHWCVSCAVGGCRDIDGPGMSLSLCGNDLSWCTDLGECGEVSDPLETTFGCQYFGEEGPDDLSSCILTVIDIMCCGCISGYDQCEA